MITKKLVVKFQNLARNHESWPVKSNPIPFFSWLAGLMDKAFYMAMTTVMQLSPPWKWRFSEQTLPKYGFVVYHWKVSLMQIQNQNMPVYHSKYMYYKFSRGYFSMTSPTYEIPLEILYVTLFILYMKTMLTSIETDSSSWDKDRLVNI